jgi:hypothetical protein
MESHMLLKRYRGTDDGPEAIPVQPKQIGRPSRYNQSSSGGYAGTTKAGREAMPVQPKQFGRQCRYNQAVREANLDADAFCCKLFSSL